MCAHVHLQYVCVPQTYWTSASTVCSLLLSSSSLQVRPDTVVEVWKGNPDSRPAITKAGLQAIYSACWYLNIIRYGPDWLAVG